jgi:hypothetical protein
MIGRCIATACVVLSTLSFSLAKDSTAAVPRTVQLEQSIPNDLVKVVEVMLGDTEIKLGVPFPADDEWFNRLRFVIKNVSTKRIVFVDGWLRFPQTGDETAENLVVMDRILLGHRPEPANDTGAASRRPDYVPSIAILVNPGGEMTVPVIDSLNRMRTAIEKRQPLSSITIAAIGIGAIYFDDGTAWMKPGLYFRADPDMPGSYVRISHKEFYADSAASSTSTSVE